MKKTVLAVMVLGLSSAALAGGNTSNGPIGKEVLQCDEGQLKLSRDDLYSATLSIAPQLNKGLVARLAYYDSTSSKSVSATVIANKKDSRGFKYEGKDMEILIPEMQPPADPAKPGQVKVIVLQIPGVTPLEAPVFNCVHTGNAD